MSAATDDAHPPMAVIDLFLQVARRFAQAVHEQATRYDLTPMQVTALSRVGADAVPTSQIAQHLRCDPSNATGLVDQLERRGLVRRTTPPEDRRKRLVEATAEGREVSECLQHVMNESRGLLHRLSDAERAELHRMLLILAADDDGAGRRCSPDVAARPSRAGRRSAP